MNKETSNRRSIVIFVLLIAICMVFGYFCGRIMGHMDQNHVLTFTAYVYAVFGKGLPWIFGGMSLLLLLLSMIWYRKGRNLQQLGEEDEERFTEAGNVLNYPILFSTIAMIGSFFLFPASMETMEKGMVADENSSIFMSMTFALFAGTLAWVVIIQAVCVKSVREMNPEKMGSALDVHFKRKWTASMDEAERMVMYKAGYKAYSVTSGVCVVLWVMAFMLQLFMDTGLLPIFFVCIIYLVLVLTYSIEGMRLDR